MPVYLLVPESAASLSIFRSATIFIIIWLFSQGTDKQLIVSGRVDLIVISVVTNSGFRA